MLAVLLGPVVGFGCGTADDGGSGGTSGTDEGSGGSATGGSATGGSATGGRGTGGDAGGQGDGGSGTGGVPTEGEVRAFPGAEGFGAMVSGGRGGRVVKVTTLEATGPGSLQEALALDEPRIIVFDVSGVIEADILEIPYGDVTIAGQTAPGAGITIQGRLWGGYSDDIQNIIVRHLRIRPLYDGSDGAQFDSLQFSLNRRLIFDHVSTGFGVDEIMDLYSAQDVTVQWSIIESAGTEGHPEGSHNYGLINGPDGRRVSVHHTLFANNRNRNPAIANGPADVVNNVIFNARHGFVHHNPASGPFNFVGNYFAPGPEDTLIPFFFDDEYEGASESLAYYFAGNWVAGDGASCPAGALESPWSDCDDYSYVDETHQADAPFDFSEEGDDYRAITTHSAADAWTHILSQAGAFPRDVVSERSVEEAQAGTGAWGAREPDDLLEGLTPTAAPTDSDDDGMPDAWETSHGLDPETDDSSVEMSSGYTAIEEYINELAIALIAD